MTPDGWHDGNSDGYSYCLRGPDGRLGWHCQTAMEDLSLFEEERSEDVEYHPYQADCEPQHEIGDGVKIKKPFKAWNCLADIGNPGAHSESYNPGSYAIVDAGTVNSDDELDIDVQRPFVIYAIENVAGKRAWVPEEILEAASE